MKIAAISDIHGNAYSLGLVLGDLEKRRVDRVVCLGDTVQGGAQPAETVEALRRLACPIVMGNADAWLLDEGDDTKEPTTSQQREVREWTISRLSSSDLDFLRSCQPTVTVDLDAGRRLLCFHGSPHSFDDILLPDTPNETWDQMLGGFSPSIMAGGHTHTQQLRRVREGLFFNPGSVGLAYDYHLSEESYHADPWAEYAILTVEGGEPSVEFRRVPIDVDELVRITRTSGRPHADKVAADYRYQG